MTRSDRHFAATTPLIETASRLATALAAASLVALAALVLYLVGKPIDTADFWLSLATGDTYVHEGPWPAADPLLHTAHADAPVQHQWLFAALVYCIERAFGFGGLRVSHAIAAAGIIWLVWSLLRRESAAAAAACCATAAFLVFTAWRLVQFRAELVSIPAHLLLYRLLLEDPDRPPSWKRVGASALLLCIWANMHSLFVVGLVHVCAGFVGACLRALAASRAGLPRETVDTARRALRRIGAALAIGIVVTAVNPRGFEQHLTYLSSSRETGIWSIPDDWSHFIPWDPHRYGTWLSVPAYLVVDATLILLAVSTVFAVVRYMRRPSPESLHVTDPVLLALAWSSVVALCVSLRFVWMVIFPLLFLLRFGRATMASRPAARARVQSASAVVSVVLCVAYFGNVARPRFVDYFARHYSIEGYPEASVRFLQETALEGKLYNGYAEGGFLGYWLAPRLRTFIDGRTEHYPKEVLAEYFSITSQGLARPGESILDILERRGVDVFMGQGLPYGFPKLGEQRYTTSHLEGVPGWLLIFRTLDESIYLRVHPRNSENLDRVARYFATEGVPFDPIRGLDVREVVERRPDWAIAHWMLLHGHEQLLAARSHRDPNVQYFAYNILGITYALIGNYHEQIETDREAARLQPKEKSPRRRLVFGLLHLGRIREAAQEAQALIQLDPSDPRSLLFQRVAVDLLSKGEGPNVVTSDHGRAMLLLLPLLDPTEVMATIAGGLRPPPSLLIPWRHAPAHSRASGAGT